MNIICKVNNALWTITRSFDPRNPADTTLPEEARAVFLHPKMQHDYDIASETIVIQGKVLMQIHCDEESALAYIESLEAVFNNPNDIQRLAAFNDDGTPYGLALTYDENGDEVITGAVDTDWFPGSATDVLKFYQYETDTAEDRWNAMTAEQRKAYDPVNKLAGQPNRRWDLR